MVFLFWGDVEIKFGVLEYIMNVFMMSTPIKFRISSRPLLSAVFLNRPRGGAVARRSFFSLSLFANCAVRSRDTSVRGQHGGHACGVPKQIASIVQLTPPRETSIPSTEPVRRCPNSQQNGRGQQTSVPVPARNQGGPFSKCTAACVSCYVRPANLELSSTPASLSGI